MPMDGITVGFAARELDEALAGGRIDRITQPEKDTVVMVIRANNENKALLLCASPNNARCHLTASRFSNPLEPPALCMLLRKQLTGGRILGVEQVGGDRIVHINIEVTGELGDRENRRLVLEIMGRHSNLMLLDGNGRILEAARHVNAEMSRVRLIQPGMAYEAPPAQDRLSPEGLTGEALLEKIREQGDIPFRKALAGAVTGLSFPAAQEIARRVLAPGEENPEDPAEACERVAGLLERLPRMKSPRVLYADDGEAVDVFPFPYLSRDPDRQKEFRTLSEALEAYYGTRDMQDRLKQKSATMVRLLKGHVERCEKKLALQEEELANAARMEEYRVMGEVLNAHLYELKKGMEEAVLPNWYDPDGGTVTVPLDIRLTPSQNAQRYFKKYQKARSARKTAAEQKEKTLAELDFLEGMLLDTDKCVGESELEEIRAELVRAGYMKRVTNRRQQRALPQSKPYLYRSADGIEIAVGKNAAQNDRLTLGAKPDEMWLHVKDMPGSHVIVRAEGEIPQETLKQAAQLAAWYSKGQRSSSVPVDYTRRRYVKKPSGAPAGQVIYTHQKTAFMTVEESDIRGISLIES
ncbi:MAG: NFACT family protein [Clostridia bacterium]|nr:NFACT family protein [Clostridia bacterium]